MRKQFVETVTRLLEADDRVVLLLGDIGVFGFRAAFERFPDRVYNIGILEQATISLAAGLAKTGLLPIVHTIAPFLVERALEQIKVDFGYQRLPGSFVSVGASYDYAALGSTHHCPGDVQVLTSIPGIGVVAPGNAIEFDRLLGQNYHADHATYYRLSEKDAAIDFPTSFGKAELVCNGALATVIAVGPMLRLVLEAAKGLDVNILYYSTVAPFDVESLRAHSGTGKILLCEPYYEGGLSREVTAALWPRPVLLRSVGVPRKFLTNYGHADQHSAAIGLTSTHIRQELETLINA